MATGLPPGGAADIPKEKFDLQILEAKQKLKDILKEMETAEGIEKLKNGSYEFKIKPDQGALWYVAYGT